MDWSASNIVTVALGKIIYLWNAGTGNIVELREYENGDHACSLAWIQEGNIVAIGGNDGNVELWDCETKKWLESRLRDAVTLFRNCSSRTCLYMFFLFSQFAKNGWPFGSCWIVGMEFIHLQFGQSWRIGHSSRCSWSQPSSGHAQRPHAGSLRSQVVNRLQILGQRWQWQLGEHLAIDDQLECECKRTIAHIQSASSGRSCTRMVSVAAERIGIGRWYSWSLYQILEHQHRHGHGFGGHALASVCPTLVGDLQGIDFGSRLRKQPVDHLEVSDYGKTMRIDRTHVTCTADCHVARWQHRG